MPAEKVADTRRVVFNNRLDAAVTGFFALLIVALLAEAALEWYRILTGRRPARAHREPLRADEVGGGLAVRRLRAAWLRGRLAPPPRVERGRGLRDLPRAGGESATASSREAFYLDSLRRRYRGPNRCC